MVLEVHCSVHCGSVEQNECQGKETELTTRMALHFVLQYHGTCPHNKECLSTMLVHDFTLLVCVQLLATIRTCVHSILFY